jgi:twinkle protein
MRSVGDNTEGLFSMRDAGLQSRVPEALPNVGAAHKRLMDDEEALDYLIGTRGFSSAIIEKYQLGVEEANGIKWLLIPYHHKGSVVYVKKRSLPPAKKAFMGTAGRECPLFNQDAIIDGMPELLFVEGEADCLSCLSNSITAVVGVPGANVKKAAWIEKLDEAKIEKVYILYDTDKVGQQAARDMAARIGIEKCFNILLPEFETIDGTKGKDINEWFRAGHSIEEFAQLKKAAKPFDVEGVKGTVDVLMELEEEFLERGGQPAVDTPWPSLTARVGGFEWGDLVGIIAEGKIGKTTKALNMLEYYTKKYNYNTFMYCLETHKKRLVRKWLSHVFQLDDSPGAKSEITLEKIREGREYAASREAEVLFGYTRSTTPEIASQTIRQVVRRYGVKIVCFDNLQFLARSVTNQTQELGAISKMFKDLAMELNIIILLIVQPNRVKDGEIVAARNANGSSAIEKDVDCMIALHRNRIAKIKADDFAGFLETDDNFEPAMLVRVDLSRYAPGGTCTLWMDGGRSTVREFNPEELSAIPKPLVGGQIPTEELQPV